MLLRCAVLINSCEPLSENTKVKYEDIFLSLAKQTEPIKLVFKMWKTREIWWFNDCEHFSLELTRAQHINYKCFIFVTTWNKYSARLNYEMGQVFCTHSIKASSNLIKEVGFKIAYRVPLWCKPLTIDWHHAKQLLRLQCQVQLSSICLCPGW